MKSNKEIKDLVDSMLSGKNDEEKKSWGYNFNIDSDEQTFTLNALVFEL